MVTITNDEKEEPLTCSHCGSNDFKMVATNMRESVFECSFCATRIKVCVGPHGILKNPTEIRSRRIRYAS
jgi:hypothetical protein